MKVKKHILLIDDVTTNLKCLGELLRKDYAISMAKSGEQALKMLEKIDPDLILLDVKMPGLDGYETYGELKKMPGVCDIPVIFLTADADRDAELKCLNLGAYDFIRKPFEPDIMIGRIERVLKQDEEKKLIKNEALQDPLTGLWNRKYIKKEVEKFIVEGGTGSFLILDLDNFKGINDNYGHVIGDKALVSFAKTLTGFVHKDDIVARIGGDEFAVFLKNCYGKELLSERIDGLVKQVEKEIKASTNNNPSSSVSIGVSFAPFGGNTFIELYNNADKALYYVKRNGKSGYKFYDAEVSYSFSDKENSEVLDLSHLRKFIDEKKISDGPFNVDYKSFKDIYQFLKRYVARTGQSVQLVLFTLKNLDLTDDQKDFKDSMAALDKAVIDSLRKNDISSKYSENQHLLILMDCSEENRKIVVGRILSNFNSINEDTNILLKYDIEEIKGEK